MAKAKQSKLRGVTELPAGFKPIQGMGAFWKGESPGDFIMGKLVKVHIKHFEKNGKYAARDANVYTLDVKDRGRVEVTESGGLGALRQVKKGQSVHILFVGMKKLKGKSPMREYVVGVK